MRGHIGNDWRSKKRAKCIVSRETIQRNSMKGATVVDKTKQTLESGEENGGTPRRGEITGKCTFFCENKV